MGHRVTVTSRDAMVRTIVAESPLDHVIPWADVSVRLECDGLSFHPKPRPMVHVVSQSINGCEWEILGVFSNETKAEEHADSHLGNRWSWEEWEPIDTGRQRESVSGIHRQRIESWDVL